MKLRTVPALLALVPLLSAARAAAQLPAVPVPAENPITEQKRVLGKILFWEEQLSSDDTVACGTCHIMSSAGSDPRRGNHPGFDSELGTEDDVIGSPGVVHTDAGDEYEPTSLFDLELQVTGRASPSVVGAQWSTELFWDGRAGSTFLDPQTGRVSIASGGALENQSVGPPLSDVEMAHAARDWAQVVTKLEQVTPMALASDLPPDVSGALASGEDYPTLFADAFGDPQITAERIAFAIATYERTLVADQTPFDLGSMTQQQQAGFNNLTDHTVCLNCHEPPLFSDDEFYNIGLRPSVEDLGREGVNGDADDRGAFRVPTLRNVALKSSLMHVGWIDDVQDAIDFYNANTQRTGHTQFPEDQSSIPPGGGIYANINMPAFMQGSVIEFIENGLLDPRVAAEVFPFDRPTLHSESLRPNPEQIGEGSAGSGGFVPRLIANRPPSIGSTSFRIGIRNALGGAVAFVAVSSEPPGSNGIVNGFRSAVPIVLDGVGAGAGYGTLAIPLPDGPAHIGAEIYVQWLVVDAGASGGLSLSAVAHATFF